jgi:hypothetical protein
LVMHSSRDDLKKEEKANKQNKEREKDLHL